MRRALQPRSGSPIFYNFPGYPLTTHEYEAGIGFTAYELDLFGRIRSMNKQAQEIYFSYAETRTSAQITLVSEVAAQYFTWLADQELLRLTKDTLTAQQASFDLTERRFKAGISTELDLRQTQTAVDLRGATLAQYTSDGARSQRPHASSGHAVPPRICRTGQRL